MAHVNIYQLTINLPSKNKHKHTVYLVTRLCYPNRTEGAAEFSDTFGHVDAFTLNDCRTVDKLTVE